MPEPCGCTTDLPPAYEAHIVHCPLHAAAGKMLAALEERYEMDVEAKERIVEGTFNEAGIQ